MSKTSTTGGADRASQVALAIGLTAPWLISLVSQPIGTFYKEWLCVVAFAFAGLIGAPLLSTRERLASNPLAFAALSCIVVACVQAAVLEGAWRRAALTSFAAAFFIFAIALGRSMREREGDASLAWIAKCVLVAAGGSCVLAVIQVAWPQLPFVLPSAGGRLAGNIGQPNHFADLLWVAGVAAAFLYARGDLRLRHAVALIAISMAFSVTSGSRMTWVFAAAMTALAAACWLRRSEIQIRRFAGALIALVVLSVAMIAALSLSGALESIGLLSAEQRVADGNSEESTSQRLWFARVGLSAVVAHPLLGAGVGHFPGEGLELAMRVADPPNVAADAQAHNIFVQLAAECGLPLALVVLSCFLLWLVRAWRAQSDKVHTVGAIGMSMPILIHANLEHPLGFLYFLGLLGLLVGQVQVAPRVDTVLPGNDKSAPALRVASFALLASAALGYVQYAQVERAMETVSRQVWAGTPPQPSQVLNARLAAVPPWSVFGDYSELIALLSAIPTAANSQDLARRCERAMPLGPSPQLLARCATVLEVAKQHERASYFANSLCTIYPKSADVLAQSMSFVEQFSPAAADVQSSCVRRAN